MRSALLCSLALLVVATPAAAWERREILTKDRVLGTITQDLGTHEYLLEVPRDATLTLALPSLPALVGAAVYTQALIVDNATERARFTTYTVDQIL